MAQPKRAARGHKSQTRRREGALKRVEARLKAEQDPPSKAAMQTEAKQLRKKLGIQ